MCWFKHEGVSELEQLTLEIVQPEGEWDRS